MSASQYTLKMLYSILVSMPIAKPVKTIMASAVVLVTEMRALIAGTSQMVANAGDISDGSSETPGDYALHSVSINASLVSFLGSPTWIYRGG